MRQVKINYDIIMDVCNFDWDLNQDRVYSRLFHAGEVYSVTEISPVDDFTDVIDFDLLGFCEIPREAWSLDGSIRLIRSELVCLN